MKNFLLIYLTSILLSLISCSASDSDKNPPEITIAELKEKLNMRSGKINSLVASGNISFDSPERSGSGWFEIKLKKPDTIYIKIEGPFGISIANALITRNDFIFYNVQENTVIRGHSTELNIGAILKIKISFEQLINGLTGGFRFQVEPGDTMKAKVEERNYIIENYISSGYEKFHIAPDIYLKKYEFKNLNGTALLETDYSAHVREEISKTALDFPRKISIKNKTLKQSVYMEYENVSLNNEEIMFSIKIPSSAKQLKWD